MTQAAPHAGLEYVLAHIIQDFMQFMHQSGLSRLQIHALLHIYHAGECRISEIAALAESSPPAASQLVERLVQQGWVQRTEDPLNRRIKKLRLTDRSLKLISEGVTSNRFLVDLMSALSAKQRETVQTAFGYLAQASHKTDSSNKRKVEHHAQNA
jgi:DNA-binding MarR family transcriptional regulator